MFVCSPRQLIASAWAGAAVALICVPRPLQIQRRCSSSLSVWPVARSSVLQRQRVACRHRPHLYPVPCALYPVPCVTAPLAPLPSFSSVAPEQICCHSRFLTPHAASLLHSPPPFALLFDTHTHSHTYYIYINIYIVIYICIYIFIYIHIHSLSPPLSPLFLLCFALPRLAFLVRAPVYPSVFSAPLAPHFPLLFLFDSPYLPPLCLSPGRASGSLLLCIVVPSIPFHSTRARLYLRARLLHPSLLLNILPSLPVRFQRK